MQEYLIAKNDYENNYDILLDFNIYDILLNTKKSSRPNIALSKKNNSVFFKTINPIKKGELLSIDLGLNKNIISQKGGFKMEDIKLELSDFFKTSKKVISFIECQNFKADNIRKLKNEVNTNKFFKLNNKMIYQAAKELKNTRKELKNTRKVQKGGSMNDQDGMTNKIEVLPDVEVGSFIHHPQAITMTQKIDKLHLLLDLIGLIPIYGVAADVVNFLLYFVRGEYSDAFYSLICMIPTVGSLIGLSAKYIVKFIYNRNPDYRKYYNSMASLKDITKELRIVENKHLDLDNIAYDEDNEDFNP